MSTDETSITTRNTGMFAPGDPRINRAGRPPKPRSLTALLESEISTVDLAGMLRDALATGKFTFPESDVEILIKDSSEVVALYKFIFRQVDPPTNVSARYSPQPSIYEGAYKVVDSPAPTFADADKQELVDQLMAIRSAVHGWIRDDQMEKFVSDCKCEYERIRHERMDNNNGSDRDDYGNDE